MDPEQEVGIVGAVALPGDGVDAVDPRVHRTDACRRGFGGRGVAVGGVDDEARGAREASPRVLAELAVLVDRGHRTRLERLHEQRAQASDEHHGIGVESPRHAVGPEDPEVGARGGYSCSSIATLSITSPTCVASATSIPSVT